MKQLTKDTKSAKKEIEDIKQLSIETPYTPQELGQVAVALRKVTQNGLGGIESLILIGDAAAAAGVPLNEIANNVGRLYGQLKRGEPVGEVTRRLGELGIFSGETNTKLKKLVESGAKLSKTWPIVVAELEKSKGTMKELAQTFHGKMSTAKGNIFLLFAKLGEKALPKAKEGLDGVNQNLEKLMSSGSIRVLSEAFTDLFNSIINGGIGSQDTIKGLIEATAIVVESLSGAIKAVGKFSSDFQSLVDQIVNSSIMTKIFDKLGGQDAATGRAANNWELKDNLTNAWLNAADPTGGSPANSYVVEENIRSLDKNLQFLVDKIKIE